MEEQLELAIKNVAENAQYDKYAKKLLSNKVFLAYILKDTIPDLSGLSPAEIISLIEGEVEVSEVPVDPGMTNQYMNMSGNRITGNNTEDSELEEGTIIYDIIFYVRLINGLSRMIINIEAQKDASPGYPIMNRAIFYTSRMISSQKEREFTNLHYENMIKVFSIWLCFNMRENCLNYFYVDDNAVIGHHVWSGDQDLFNFVLVGLDQDYTEKMKEERSESELHHMLGVIFSDRLNGKEKVKLLQEDLQIYVSDEMKEELDVMCNLSYGIEERGRAEGRLEATIEAIQKMIKKNYSNMEIQEFYDVSDSFIEKIKIDSTNVVSI